MFIVRLINGEIIETIINFNISNVATFSVAEISLKIKLNELVMKEEIRIFF